MTRKRDALEEPSSVKRRKLADNFPSESQSPAQGRLTESERAELLRWLDQADKKDGPIFNVSNPPARKGAKNPSDVQGKPLRLNDRDYLDARWLIKPNDRWLNMTKYKKLYALNPQNSLRRISLTLISTVGNQTHSVGDCVLVKPGNESDRDWKAQVHEVRAADEHHVFLRCTWLENPEELPQEARMTPPYHGKFELVPGNKMDIIDALTVNGPLKVVHWEEDNDDAPMPAQGEYYWRQTYNYDTKQLSDAVQRRNQQNGDKAESKGKKRARKSINKNYIKSAEDAVAEDDTIRAEVPAPESEAPKIIITDKKTGDETEEAVHCLVCKELVE
ncbi:hypothetical protein E4T49_07084 [Aureobasidium sp. EXF-10728]|nr:hypothetical protein E4T49_07084 [Aureobasidium sp. EXF-10728]